MKDWRPPEDWLKITTIDAHTGGEPLRVITGGCPELPGHTILERRRYAKENLDHLRTHCERGSYSVERIRDD